MSLMHCTVNQKSKPYKVHGTGTVNFVTKKLRLSRYWRLDMVTLLWLYIQPNTNNSNKHPKQTGGASNTCSILSLCCSKIGWNEVKMEFGRFVCWISVIIQCVHALDLLDCQSKSICGHLQTCDSENQICDYNECILGKLSRAKRVANITSDHSISFLFVFKVVK